MYPTKVSIANNKGFESITAISRAFEVGTPAEDVVLSKYTLVPDDKRAFLIIPLAAGTNYHDSERYRFKAAKGGSWK